MIGIVIILTLLNKYCNVFKHSSFQFLIFTSQPLLLCAVRTYKKGASWKSGVLLAAPAGERLMSGGNRITAGKPISRETLFATINNSLTVSACAFIIADRRQNCKRNVSTEIVTNAANTTRPREAGGQWPPLRLEPQRDRVRRGGHCPPAKSPLLKERA